MIKISKKMEYALMALKHLADHSSEHLVSARDIAKQYKIPFDTLSKVMQLLNSNEVVTSLQGIKGGYRLTKNLEELNYRELERMIEGKTSTLACLNNAKSCDLINVCNIISPVQKLELKLNKFLFNLNLKELLIEENILNHQLQLQVNVE